MTIGLVAFVLGNRNSGKSHTWNTLFGKTVRTGRSERRLWLNRCEYVDLFLVSGSPEERSMYVGEIIADQSPRIVLCSVQYRDDARDTIDYFLQQGYEIYVQWLNPGRSDSASQQDTAGIFQHLIDVGATACIRDGSENDAQPRTNEIRNFVNGWSTPRGLVFHDPGWR